MKWIPGLISFFLLVSCASLPAIRPSAGPAGKEMTCPSPFLTQKTRFIHTIEASLSGKTQAVLIGVTIADPDTQTISCAILSPEGMALLEASGGPSGLIVNRALPPFDAPDFARNMMDDIGLIFLAPSGAQEQKGLLASGEAVCRWHKEQGGWVDVSEGRDGQIQIRRYSEGGRLKRSILLRARAVNAYSAIELQASEDSNYALVMTLIEVETIE